MFGLERGGQWIKFLGALVVGFAFVQQSAQGAAPGYNRDIRPILAANCLQCHGPDAQGRKGKFRLDIEAEAREHAINTAQPDQSELLRRIASSDPAVQMPPPNSGKVVTAEQATTLKTWIRNGARYEKHWAFEPISKPQPPAVAGASSAIDRFVISALKSRGLALSPAITKTQWIRRVTLDLTGLAPTWQEVEAYTQDTSADAKEKVVDRLLASPRYGERWGRHWLDLARYADTHGGSAIGFTRFPFSYTYRDYVIQAFNDDLPYNRFVTEQIAADQLGLEGNDPSLAALGFLTVGMQYRNRHDVIDDQIDVISRGLQGLTVACARCHDHKFDPISTEDYYSLYASLAGSKAPATLPVLSTPTRTEAMRDYERELARRQASHDDLAAEHIEIMKGRLRNQVGLYLRELAKGLPEQDTATAFLSYRTDDIRPVVYNRWRDYVLKMTETDPVFGPWVRLSRADPKTFAATSSNLVQTLKTENGDPAKFKDLQKLTTEAPRWNPKVLEALSKKTLESMMDVADAYGQLFTDTHQSWLKSLQAASAEAGPGATIYPDEDPRQLEINSAVHRQLRRHLYGPNTPTALPDEVAGALLNRTVSDNLGGRAGAVHDWHLNAPGSPARAMALEESRSTDPSYIFRRGNPLNRGAVVSARYLPVLSPLGTKPFMDGQRRLGLARSITAEENPLTRRVLVNWVWQHHFGQGLVRSADDWGTRGYAPSHPELLDYLATTFAEDGWSIKKLHRRILLSQVYAQSAIENVQSRNADPDNELLWRMPRRRLDLESMLDSMLSISGELDLTPGGRPFDRQAQPGVLRRAVYAFVNRDIVSNLASTFDGANPSACTARRPDTSVPQQTLFALNSDFIQDRAVALSASVLKSASDDEARVRELYRRVLAREPQPVESDRLLRFVKAASGSNASAGWQQAAHVLLASNEFAFID